MTKCDEDIDDAITDNDKDGKTKYKVGNLTLLDSPYQPGAITMLCFQESGGILL